MDYYYVYIATPAGPMPIGDFKEHEGVIAFDSTERLSLEEATQRRDQLAYRHPRHSFFVMELKGDE